MTTMRVDYALALTSWEGWRIWTRQLHVTAQALAPLSYGHRFHSVVLSNLGRFSFQMRHSFLPVTLRRKIQKVPSMKSFILLLPCSFVDFVAWWDHYGRWKMMTGVMLRRIFISICFVFRELYRILEIRHRHFILLLGR